MAYGFADTQFEIPHVVTVTRLDDAYERHIDALPPTRYVRHAHDSVPTTTALVSISHTPTRSGRRHVEIDPLLQDWWQFLALTMVMTCLMVDALVAYYLIQAMPWIKSLMAAMGVPA